MKIDVILYAQLACLLPGDRAGNATTLEVQEGCTVRDVLISLNVPLNAPKILFVNGRHAKDDQVLSEGNRLAVFPPIAGG